MFLGRWKGCKGRVDGGIQSADVRVRRAESESMRVVGSIACYCWIGGNGGSW